MAVSLTKISSTQSSITVEAWHNISNGSRVYWSIDGREQSGYDLLSSGGYRQRTFSGLRAGTEYTIGARIVNGALTSLPTVGSTSRDFSTDSAPQPPSTPSGFSAEAVSQTGIYLSWRSVSGAEYYELWNDTIGRREQIFYQTSWTWVNLSPATSYSFSIKAVGTNGLSSGWAYASARTNSPPPPPSTPTGVSAYPLSQTGIQISWNRVSDASEYYIYNTVTGGTRSTYLTYIDWTGLTHSTRYGFQVQARNQYGNSSYSNTVYATTNSPPVTNAPSGFSLSAVSATSVRASWNSVSGATNYQVSFFSGSSVVQTTTATSLTITNLLPNTYYGAYVKAYSGAGGWSVASNSAYVTTPIARPSNFSWTNSKTSGGTFNLTATEWNRLCATINSFRSYKGFSNYSFTTAYSGGTFTASQYNEARNAINTLNPSVSIPDWRTTGDIIYANDINRLRDSINSVT